MNLKPGGGGSGLESYLAQLYAAAASQQQAVQNPSVAASLAQAGSIPLQAAQLGQLGLTAQAQAQVQAQAQAQRLAAAAAAAASIPQQALQYVMLPTGQHPGQAAAQLIPAVSTAQQLFPMAAAAQNPALFHSQLQLQQFLVASQQAAAAQYQHHQQQQQLQQLALLQQQQQQAAILQQQQLIAAHNAYAQQILQHQQQQHHHQQLLAAAAGTRPQPQPGLHAKDVMHQQQQVAAAQQLLHQSQHQQQLLQQQQHQQHLQQHLLQQQNSQPSVPSVTDAPASAPTTVSTSPPSAIGGTPTVQKPPPPPPPLPQSQVPIDDPNCTIVRRPVLYNNTGNPVTNSSGSTLTSVKPPAPPVTPVAAAPAAAPTTTVATATSAASATTSGIAPTDPGTASPTQSWRRLIRDDGTIAFQSCSGDFLDNLAAVKAFCKRPAACLCCLPESLLPDLVNSDPVDGAPATETTTRLAEYFNFDPAADATTFTAAAAAARATCKRLKRRPGLNGDALGAGEGDSDSEAGPTPSKRQMLVREDSLATTETRDDTSVAVPAVDGEGGSSSGGGDCNAPAESATDERALDDYLSQQEAAYRGSSTSIDAAAVVVSRHPHSQGSSGPRPPHRWPKPFGGPRGPPHPRSLAAGGVPPFYRGPPMRGVSGGGYRGGYPPRQKFPPPAQQQPPQ